MKIPIEFRTAKVIIPVSAGNSAHRKTKGKKMETVKDALNEVRRERLVRTTVYPRLVAAGKLTQGEAHRRLTSLQWAEAHLAAILRSGSLPEATPYGFLQGQPHHHD